MATTRFPGPAGENESVVRQLGYQLGLGSGTALRHLLAAEVGGIGKVYISLGAVLSLGPE